MLKRLKVLARDDVTEVTGTSLQGQYVGETKGIVTKALVRARGGVLLIDEAQVLPVPAREDCGCDGGGSSTMTDSWNALWLSGSGR